MAVVRWKKVGPETSIVDWASVRHGQGKVFNIFPGDAASFEPGESPWHGAAPNSLMVHLTAQQTDTAGVTALWLKHVSDADYNRKNS